MTNHLSDRLAAIRERAEAGGARTMQLGGDPNGKVWPAETWKICLSQADVLPLVEAAEAVLKKCDDYLKWERENPREPFEFGMAEAARDVQYILTEKLGEDDEQ